MINLLLKVLLILTAQSDCLSELREDYQTAKFSSPKNLKIELYDCLFDNGEVYSDVDTYEIMKVFTRNSGTSAIIKGIVGAGPGGDVIYIYSFSDNGSIVKSSFLGANYTDGESGEICELEMVNDSIIQVNNFTYSELNKEEEKEVNYYFLKKETHSLIILPRVDERRRFKSASQHILTHSELDKLSISDLDIMRNEIFAGHGYIFSSAKWKKYFQAQDWYEGKHSSVDEQISIVEQINISNILKEKSARN